MKLAADPAFVFSHASNLITTCQESGSTQFFEKWAHKLMKKLAILIKNHAISKKNWLVQHANTPMSTNLDDSWLVCLSDWKMNLSNTRNWLQIWRYQGTWKIYQKSKMLKVIFPTTFFFSFIKFPMLKFVVWLWICTRSERNLQALCILQEVWIITVLFSSP